MLDDDLPLIVAGRNKGDSASLEYLGVITVVFFNVLEVSTNTALSGLLGTITERGSATVQTAVAAVEWHMKPPFIFLLVFMAMAYHRKSTGKTEKEGV